MSFLDELDTPVITIAPVPDTPSRLLRDYQKGDDGLYRKRVTFKNQSIILVRRPDGRLDHTEKVINKRGQIICRTTVAQ